MVTTKIKYAYIVMAFWGPPNILKYVIIIWSLKIAVYPENKEIFIYSDNSLTPSPFIEVPALYFILSRIIIFFITCV